MLFYIFHHFSALEHKIEQCQFYLSTNKHVIFKQTNKDDDSLDYYLLSFSKNIDDLLHSKQLVLDANNVSMETTLCVKLIIIANQQHSLFFFTMKSDKYC
jgi:hypothetical protein